MGTVNSKLKKMNVFERIEYARSILRPVTEGISDNDLTGLILNIQTFREGRRKKLSSQHRAIYDILLKHQLNPKTVYQWMLLEKAPGHIKEKLRSGKIGIKNASQMSYAWRKMVSTRSGKEIISQMRAVIGGLQWRGQEEIKIRN